METEVMVKSPESAKIYTAKTYLGGTADFSMYECLDEESRSFILKIATDPSLNGILDREAFHLQKMLEGAKELEEKFLASNPGTTERMNYHFIFPRLVETFISSEQKSRRILILSLDAIADNLSELVPLSHLASRENVRIDRRTSAWVLGKLLKSLVFSHSLGITNGMVFRDNILLHKKNHLVALFNWCNSKMQDPVDPEETAIEIAQLAMAITSALGGDVKTGKIPTEGSSEEKTYDKFIRKLALGKESNAQRAHSEFYAMVDRLWPKEYYAFTTFPIGE